MNNLEVRFDLSLKEELVKEYEDLTLAPGFFSDKKSAKDIIEKLNFEKKILADYKTLEVELIDLSETFELVKDSFDKELLELFEEDFLNYEKKFHEFEVYVLLTGPYDNHHAILELHPGAGGTESQDWASILMRMYLRWGELHEFKTTVLDYQSGDEAGLKSTTILFEGKLAYGYLKAEKGVHRLVRISPFDSSGRRHTSFCSVDIMPQFEEANKIEILDSDLIMETHRASGAGGQHVNKTDSAVRLIHKPTGLVANCQTERSQHANRDRALLMLKSKLFQKELEEQQSKLANIKGEQKSIEWGSQIRSYVFAPYTLVKDHRTNYETNNVEKVLDGDIDEFIYEYLKESIT